jgi:outer membrane protein assembly factor BamB
MKLPNNNIVCLFEDGKVAHFDALGKELSSFHVDLGMKLFGGRIHALTNGNVLIPHHLENKVVEYNTNGKMVWQVRIDQPIAAVRLPNGNTIVTSMNQNRAVEFDRDGKEVWQYRQNTRVTRAIRR